MEIDSAGPFRVASLLRQPRLGTFTLTVVCRATFHLEPVECPLAREQDPPLEEDNHWNDDPSRSLYAPSDLVPFKPRADVLLVGNAFAPRREPVASLTVRLLVGDVDKSIEVFGERSFSQEGQLREGARFAKMPLRWERAAGGPETSNPVGMRLDARDGLGSTPIPSLQPPGLHLTRRGEHVPPIGFGPIAPSWPERQEKLGISAGAWPPPGWSWEEQPLPEGIEPGFFNAAPRDQQVDELRDNERLILENLHPDHPRLITSLPGVRPRVMVERMRGIEPLAMRADTLWIDTDRGLCTVTWRGQLSLESAWEPGRVVVTLERGGRSLADAPGEPSNADESDGLRTMLPVMRKATVLPFVARPAAESPMAHAEVIEEVSIDEELPAEPDAAEERGLQTMRIDMRAPRGGATSLPFLAAPDTQEVSAPGPTAPMAPVHVAPPALVAAPISMDPIAPPRDVSRWAGVDARPGGGPTVGAAVVFAKLATEIAAAPNAAGGGLLAASDAAAGLEGRQREESESKARAAAVLEPRPRPTREVVKLVWFDPKSVKRIRKHTDWRVILAELELRLLDADEDQDDDDDEREAGAADPKDRRDVFEVLLRGAATAADGVKRVMDAAVGEDGRFEPPLVLLAGELEMPFDELETLKATAMAARPLSSGDKKLKEVLDTVDELLKTPWLSGSGGIAEGLTDRVREAFAGAKRMVAGDHLEAHTERMLLEQRAYQRRTVYGKKWIRSVMRGSGVPVYLPEALKDELPMFQRFKVKLVGEVDMREDQGEVSGCAVKVLALGRVVG
jgi:hypothetical protein